VKTVIIGAGSSFGSQLSIDILSRLPIHDATIALCDINAERLETVRKYVQSAIDHHRLPAKLEVSTERRDVLRDADFVVLSVSVGGPAYHDEPYESEIRIPETYGIHQNVGDTVSPGGIFRALRTAPVLEEFCRDINELAPRATIINYTNPMAILTWCLNAWSDVPVVGLCHGIQGTSKTLAGYIDVPYEETGHWAAGINHMAWFVDFTHKGTDAYPRIREAMQDPEIYKQDPIRFDIMKTFGYFCSESSRHSSEYMPYFRDRTDLMKQYRDKTIQRKDRLATWYENMGVKASQAGSIELIRSHEYASGIMEASVTGTPFRLNGNVMNHDLIPNLPAGCCVEVPCMADGEGLHPCRFGALPEQCAALCRTNVNVQELTVKAVLERNPEAAFQALLLDPITAAALSIDKARAMFEEMWEAGEDLLGYYDRSPRVGG